MGVELYKIYYSIFRDPCAISFFESNNVIFIFPANYTQLNKRPQLNHTLVYACETKIL